MSGRLDRVRLMIDGDHACALLGENLQEGEAEFVRVFQREEEPLHWAQERACWTAFYRLMRRLGRTRETLSYEWYPRKPGSAGP